MAGRLFPGLARGGHDRLGGGSRTDRLFSDLHVNRGANQTLYAQRLDRAVAEINAAHVDLVLLGGDLTENGTAAEARDFKRQIKALQAPVWFIPGNHDVGNKLLPGGKPGVSFRRVADYEMRLGRSYFAREQSGVRVLGINSALLGSGLIQENRMNRLLEREFARTNPPPTLILLHHPPFQQWATEPGGVYWNLEPSPRADLLSRAQQANVQAILSGHLHKSLTNTHEGITLLTAPSVAFGLVKGKPSRGWYLLTVDGTGFQHEFHPLPDSNEPSR